MSVVYKKAMFGACSLVSRLQLPIAIFQSWEFCYKKWEKLTFQLNFAQIG